MLIVQIYIKLKGKSEITYRNTIKQTEIYNNKLKKFNPLNFSMFNKDHKIHNHDLLGNIHNYQNIKFA